MAENQKQVHATMRSWYCATWNDEDGKEYYADPQTGERKPAELDKRMRLTLGNSENPQLSDADAALLSQREAAIDQKLSHAVPGLPVKLSESESLILLRRKNGESHRTFPRRNKAKAHVLSKH